jgi:hypothetical protein
MKILIIISLATAIPVFYHIRSKLVASILSITGAFTLWISLHAVVGHPMVDFGRHFVSLSLFTIASVVAVLILLIFTLQKIRRRRE